MRRFLTASALLFTFVALVTLSGCGGGSKTNGAGTISGTVTDVAGNLVPGSYGGSYRQWTNYQVSASPEFTKSPD